MQFTIGTLVIIVMCVIVLLAAIMILMSSQGQSVSLIEGIFDFFRSVGA